MKRTITAIACIGILSVEAGAAGWTWHAAKDGSGGNAATAMLKESGFIVSLSCRAGDSPDVFQLTFVGDNFPYLPTEASAQSQLIFKFDGEGMENTPDGWADVTYFAPDKAWTGSLYMEPGTLDAFAAASSMRVVSDYGEEVARFPMSGAQEAQAMLRRICHEGQPLAQ